MAKDYDSAEKYFNLAEQASSGNSNHNLLVRSKLYHGIVDYEKGAFSEAKVYFLEGLDQINGLGNYPDLSTVYLYLGKIFAHEGELDKAKELIQKSLDFAVDSYNTRDKMNAQLALIDLEFTQTRRLNHSMNLRKFTNGPP